MSKKDGNGDEIPEATESKLKSILNRARVREAKEEQEAFKRTHAARKRSRQARVKARDDKKEEGT